MRMNKYIKKRYNNIRHIFFNAKILRIYNGVIFSSVFPNSWLKPLSLRMVEEIHGPVVKA